MIRQEKRKRRWLEKNGFIIVTEQNSNQLIELSEELDDYVNKIPGCYYAYSTYERWGRTNLCLIDNTFIKRDLHEIKLDYLVKVYGQQPTSTLARMGYKMRRFNRQCVALIKHGVNPWW